MAQDWTPIPPLSEVTTGDPISALFDALRDDVGDEGFFDHLGPDHAAQFTDGSETLLVAFEQTESLLRQKRGFRPLARGVQSRGDIAQLTLLARRETWFRAPEIYTFFDDLIDDGFFDDFSRVIFYGAGAQGYAAATYSVAAPGAEVLLIQPQATLTPAGAGWDDRHTETRKMDFTSRYGYAPSMMETASKGYVIVDPAEREDFMHACLFRRDGIEIIRQRYLGANAEARLDAAGLLDSLLDLIVSDAATPSRIVNCLRPRRDQYAHLNRVLTLTEAAENDWRSGVVARHANARMEHTRFSTAFDAATASLAADGRTLPGVSADAGLAQPEPSDIAVSETAVETSVPSDTAVTEQPVETPEPSDTAVAEQPVETPAPSDTAVTEQPVETPAPSDTAVSEQPVETPALSDTAVAEQPVEMPAPSDTADAEQPVETPAPSDAHVIQPTVETPVAGDVAPHAMAEQSAPALEEAVDVPQTEPVVEADFEKDPAQVAELSEIVEQIPDPAQITETAAPAEDPTDASEDLPFADGILTPSGAAPVSNWPSAETPSLREAHPDGAEGAALMSPGLVEPASPGAVPGTPTDPVKQRLSQSLQTRRVRTAPSLSKPTRNTRPGKRKR